MDTIRYEAAHALRSLLRAPKLALAVVLTLAAGIGVVSAFFSLLNGIAFRPLPYPEGEELVELREGRPGQAAGVSLEAYAALRSGMRTLDGVAAYETEPVNLATDAWVADVRMTRITPGVQDVLEVAPALGRPLGAGDAFTGSPTAVLLGHALWARLFDADPGILGRTVRVNGEPVRVVGVMPRGFAFPQRSELWTPFHETEGEFFARDDGVSVVARLGDGRSRGEAREELRGLLAGLAAEGTIPPDARARVGSLVNRGAGGFTTISWLLLGMGMLVLLVVCSNVASLLLARSARRRAEMAVRSAMGASRRRLIGHTLAEGVALAIPAGLLGLGLSSWIVRTVVATLDIPFPPWFEPRVDVTVVAFTAVVSALSVILFGLPPALAGSRLDLAEVLGSGATGVTGTRKSRRIRGAVIVAEVALAFVLVTGGALLATSVSRLQDIDFVTDGEAVLEAHMRLRGTTYEAVDARDTYLRRALDRVGTLPGVAGAALKGAPSSIRNADAHALPFDSIVRGPLLADDGGRLGRGDFGWSVVTPGYFRTVGLSGLRGRTLEGTDRPGSEPVAVVSEALARALWPDADPLGRTVRAGGEDGLVLRVVGVVESERQLRGFGAPGDGATVEARKVLYVPFAQVSSRFPDILVRSARGNALALAPAVRAALQALDPDQAVAWIRPLSTSHDRLTSAMRAVVGLVAVLAAVGAMLALMGIYGVIAQGVAERRREIGIRTALGGSARRIVRFVMRDGLRLTAAGAVLGLALALAFTRVLGSLLYDVEPWNPLVLAGVALLFLLVGGAGSLLPARRAAKVDPMEALRSE